MNQTQNRFYLIMILTSLVIIGVLVVVLVRDRARGAEIMHELTRVAGAVDEQALTLTAVAGITPFPTLTATPDHLQTVQMEATALRAQTIDLLDVARNQWAVQFRGDFGDDAYAWKTDSGEDQYAIATRSLVDGAYVWEVDAKQEFFWFETPVGAELGDFYVSAEISQASPFVGEQGILFRVADNSNFYFFSLCDSPQKYQAGRRVADEWLTLIECTEHKAISQNGSNQLEVVGKDSQFYLSINDELVDEMFDTNHDFGRFGVIVEMEAEDNNTFTFHNLEIRTPEE
ncbi:MAG: hypothetical protein ACPG8W_08295 [Candidatus Promineifilaceae bacterium]